MPKKSRDAFAFRDFDGKKILQRPFFKAWREKFHVGENQTDAEILSALTAMDGDELAELQTKAEALSDLYDCAEKYQEKRIARHIKRLAQYRRGVADKIATDENTDVEILRARHKRANELAEKYARAANGDELDTLQAIAVGVDARGLCPWIVAKYKSVSDAIKHFYRRRFAARLKQARTSKKIPRKTLANELNITTRTLISYENGEREPPLATLANLSQTLNVSADWLIGTK